MKVKSIMCTDVAMVQPTDELHKAAQLMWNKDCGVVPVVDPNGKLEGICTDRDLCMGALLWNRAPGTVRISEVMARDVRTCTPEDDVRDVHATMREHQIRRLPVVDEGRRLIGLVSINDLATEALAGRSAAATERQRDVAKTIAEISRRRADNGGASM
jgi:CBS domain-containing protein